MIKTLRTPTVFVLLTIVLGGWLLSHKVNSIFYAWRFDDQYWANRHVHRPFYHLINGRNPLRSTSGLRIHSDGLAPHKIAIRDASGLRVVDTSLLQSPGFVESVEAAGFLDFHARIDEFGLLASMLIKQTYSQRVLPYSDVPMLTVEEACHAFNTQNPPNNSGLYDPIPKVQWTPWYPAIIHDFLFLLTLIAYLISLTAIPRWTIWKRLTPAQRRRAKSQCPACAYELKGLSTTTCPECGNTIN